MTYTPWCYMPPEMHFDSPKDLKDAFWRFMESRIPDEMKTRLGQRFLPPVGKFERVKTSGGKYILVPTALDYSFLFRGQTDFYERCIPSLYRNNPSDEDVMIERMRCVELENYLLQLPQVRDFMQYKLSIDFVGLAQHYGIPTDVIDLTSSLDVALFFAMCKPDADGLTYHYCEDDGEHIGYIYAIDTCEYNQTKNNIKSLFDNKITCIGMQPFERPGSQRGFSIKLGKGETLTGLLYSFNYTPADSKAIYNYFDGGKALWHEDAITEVVREIKKSLVFSYDTMNTCLKRYINGSNKARIQMKHLLQQSKCKFQKTSPWAIGKKEIFRLEEEYARHGGFTGMNDIVERKYVIGGRKHNCITTSMMAQQQMLWLSTSGCKAPEGYGSPYEFGKSPDGKVWGYSIRNITQDTQTKPNPETKKVERWAGDWRGLPFDTKPDNPIKPRFVKVPRKYLNSAAL